MESTRVTTEMILSHSVSPLLTPSENTINAESHCSVHCKTDFNSISSPCPLPLQEYLFYRVTIYCLIKILLLRQMLKSVIQK